MQGLLEGGRGCLQLALQQPVAALKLPDQPISLHQTTSDKINNINVGLRVLGLACNTQHLIKQKKQKLYAFQ